MTRAEAIAKHGSTYRRYDNPECTNKNGCPFRGCKKIPGTTDKYNYFCILWENDGCIYRNENVTYNKV